MTLLTAKIPVGIFIYFIFLMFPHGYNSFFCFGFFFILFFYTQPRSAGLYGTVFFSIF